MEFEVTAIRKRPRTLSEMVGQEFVVATLGNALKTNHVAPAYLFSGPRGTGKTSTARILAKSLDCEQGPTDAPCGNCSSCVEIARGSSPDVIEIDGASNTSVNDVREIKDEVLYAPQSSRKKIYIVDEVHMLSNSAFNALLKTIEEPPPYIIFIFATTEVHKVPATIRSRCQQFRFRLFSPELIRDKLVEAAGEMGREFENDALFWIAREAGGSMRDAYTLFDQVLSFSEEKITLAGIREKMGLVGIESTSELLDAASKGNRPKALEILDKVLQSGIAVEQVLVELADFLRNLALLSYGIEKESLLGLSPDRFPKEPRKVWDSDKLEIAVDEAFSLFRDIRYSLNPRYELELFVGRLCSLHDRIVSSELVKRISALRGELAKGEWLENHGGAAREEVKKKIPSPPTHKAGIRGISCAVPVDIGIEFPKERQKLLIDEVKKKNLTLGVTLEKAKRWEWRDGLLQLFFESTYESALVKNESETLQKAAADAGLPAFAVEPHTDAPPSKDAEFKTNPRVELVRRVFRGEIVERQM